MRPVAIIESNPTARAELRKAVEGAGFRTDCFIDGDAALETLRLRPFSLAIFDLDTVSDPFAFCSEISRVVPLITVTSDCDAELCARALESGADDCVTRPLQPRELIARVRNVLRRTDRELAPPDEERESLTISISEMRVRNGNAVYELSRGEAELLAVLLEQTPTPLSIPRLAAILGAKPATVQSRLKSIRRKIGATRLVTRARLGYFLNLEQ